MPAHAGCYGGITAADLPADKAISADQQMVVGASNRSLLDELHHLILFAHAFDSRYCGQRPGSEGSRPGHILFTTVDLRFRRFRHGGIGS